MTRALPLTRHGHEVADEVAGVAAQGPKVGGAAAALGVGEVWRQGKEVFGTWVWQQVSK